MSEKSERYKYKHCKSPKDCCENIIVNHDDNFDYNSTLYYHCACCFTDWLITDFYDKSTIYYEYSR